jgi:hypothetical protein
MALHGTFVVGMSFSLLLIPNSTQMGFLMGIFLAFVSLMQGVEFLLWLHQECDATHKAISITGMILNHLQPVVLGLATALIFRRNVATVGLIVLAYLAVAIPYSAQYLTDANLQCTQKQSGDPHLLWNWYNMNHAKLMYGVFIAAFIGIVFAGVDTRQNAMLFSSVALITYGLSYLIYPRAHVGALWCFWTAFVPAGLYFL